MSHVLAVDTRIIGIKRSYDINNNNNENEMNYNEMNIDE